MKKLVIALCLAASTLFAGEYHETVSFKLDDATFTTNFLSTHAGFDGYALHSWSVSYPDPIVTEPRITLYKLYKGQLIWLDDVRIPANGYSGYTSYVAAPVKLTAGDALVVDTTEVVNLGGLFVATSEEKN